MRLTDNEKATLAAFNENHYSFWDGGIVAGNDSGTWSLNFVDEMASAMGITPKGARGVFASLIKKGIFETAHHEADGDSPAQEWVTLTEAGVEAIAELKFEGEMLELEDVEDEEPEPITMVQVATKKAKSKAKAAEDKAVAKVSTGTKVRFSHANCDHETQGAAGKLARAKCRKEHAAAAKAAEEKANA